MGLLDHYRDGLRGLLGSMPLVQIAQGRADMPTIDGLRAGLLAMPVFQNTPEANQAAYDAALNFGPMSLGTVGRVKDVPTIDSVGRALDRSGLSDLDRKQRNIRAAVDEFTSQVLEQRDAPSTVLSGAKMWAADAGLPEGAIRRALYSKWSASENKRLKELAPLMLSGAAR